MRIIERLVDQGRTRITGPDRLVLPPKTDDVQAAMARLVGQRQNAEIVRAKHLRGEFRALVELLYWTDARPQETFDHFLKRNQVSIAPVVRRRRA